MRGGASRDDFDYDMLDESESQVADDDDDDDDLDDRAPLRKVVRLRHCVFTENVCMCSIDWQKSINANASSSRSSTPSGSRYRFVVSSFEMVTIFDN
jgi:hypothetical protein